MFKEIEKATFSEREVALVAHWAKNDTLNQSIAQRKGKPLFSTYDGPPFATGLPHYGHYLAGTIKDVVLRYKTMKGYYVPRRFGWDCHGLPVENEIEKAEKLSGAADINKMGIATFNEKCRSIVHRYTEDWKSLVARMGRWVDFKDTFHTMDPNFMESVWWVFKQLWEKNLVYEGYKVMPFSAKLGTSLSHSEASSNYQEVDDPSVAVAISMKKHPDHHFVIWTTTPWTLVSNLAITAGPDIDYVELKDTKTGKYYILSEHSYKTYFKENFEVVCKFKGKQLEGVEYAPLFPYFADKAEKGAFKVILGDHVTVDTGTGLVHTAPAFGEEDFYAAKAAGIDPVCPVDTNGLFTDAIPEYKGQFVKEADKDICRRLKAEGRLIYQGTIHHSYPFCWRTNTPLIYRATTSWFVKVESIKDKILKANEQIHWTPGHIKDGRFGKWLAGARDWAISRSRYWGTPIPIWRSEDGDCHIIGSVEELEELTHQKITDLHRHFIDQLTFVKNGKVYRRIPEVFDCWFESGSVPYAQGHYPFEDKEGFEKGFPADFIAEGLDQTRGWFYTLTILAAALFDKPAFKNCIVNGILLAEDGNKMSKSLRNFTDPSITVDRYGADAIRLYMLSSPAVKADDLRFSEKGVELVLRQVLIPLWSAFDGFFNSYARIYKWTPKDFVHSDVVMDKWILSRVQKLIHDVDEGMKVYDLSIAVEPYTRFVDDLTNWYVRRSRRRFWSDENPQDRSKAFSTLYTVLVQLSKIAAPFIPFATESIFMHLRKDSDPQSVHLCDFPHYDAKARDVALERRMAQVQEVASLGHALRKEHKLKVRQPLPAVHVVSASQEVLHFLRQEQALLADELNVHQVIFHADETEFVETRINPKFSALGKKVGKHMRGLQAAFKELSSQHKASLLSGHAIHLVIEDQQFEITPQEVEVQRSVKPGLVAATEGQVTIVLDTSLTEELLLEGLARELINKISAERKEQNLAYTDRIKVTIDGSERLKHAYTLHKAYIDEEVLAKEVSFGPVTGVAAQLNDEMASLAVAKV